MKRHIILCAAAAFALSIAAQDFDNNPTVKIDNKEEDLHFDRGCPHDDGCRLVSH